MSAPSSDPAGSAVLLAEVWGRGGLLCEVCGPGPTPGSEWIYQSRVYIGGSLHVVGIDPESGAHRVYEPDLPGEAGAWAMVAGADGCIYLGTLPNAHLLRLDPRQGSLTDLGQPAAGEKYFWEAVATAEGRLYFGTYPSARLMCHDPATGETQDLGRVDPTQQYARHLATADGFVYVGVGSAAMRVVAHHPASGRRRNVLPERLAGPGFAVVRRGDDGAVYAAAGEARFRVRGWELEQVEVAAVPADVRDRLRPGQRDQPAEHALGDGRRVRVLATTVSSTRPDGSTHTADFKYEGRALSVYRLGAGPDGRLYGSTVLPLHFFRVEPGRGAMTSFGELGNGEVYSFLAWRDRLLAGVYGGPAPLFSYDPREAFDAGRNPRFVASPALDRSWRPLAMVAEPGPRPERVVIGSIGGYGALCGPLTEWWPDEDRVETRTGLVPDQCVVSLAAGEDLLYAGTTTAGGLGAAVTAPEAVVFGWDPTSGGMAFQVAPVPGAAELTDLVVAGGLLVGIADQRTLFAIDRTSFRSVGVAQLPFRGVVPNAIAPGPDGRLWGLAHAGVFSIDLAALEARLEIPTTAPITSGFALDGDHVYFGCGAKVLCQKLPFTDIAN